jgi:leader peptidase (prepilin peptidase)/N-methyltransferase
LVWRLHEQDVLAGKKGRAAATRRRALSISRGRSMCTHCGHELAARDLVPVLSWLWLKGKCRYCQAPIGWQYPVVEVTTGILFALSYAVWPHELHGLGLFQLVIWLIFVVGFVALAVYDLRWMLLPDRIVYPLIALAALLTCVGALWTGKWADLYQPLLAAGIIFGLFWGLFQLSKGSWIGGGDVKLAPVLGMLAGTPFRALLVIFLASLLGTLGSLPAMVHSKRAFTLKVPFGPYLLLATTIVVLFGDRIVAWYQHLLLG